MAKHPRPTPPDDEPPTADNYNAADDEVREGESMEDYMDRMDEQEAKWRGKQGGEGPSRHDVNESRHPKFVDDESWDPHLGSN